MIISIKIITTVGASEALYCVFLSMVEPEDEVCYYMFIIVLLKFAEVYLQFFRASFILPAKSQTSLTPVGKP